MTGREASSVFQARNEIRKRNDALAKKVASSSIIVALSKIDDTTILMVVYALFSNCYDLHKAKFECKVKFMDTSPHHNDAQVQHEQPVGTLARHLFTWCQAVWVEGNERALLDQTRITSRFRVSGAQPSRDTNEFIKFTRRFHRLCRHVEIRFGDTLESGNLVCTDMRISAETRRTSEQAQTHMLIMAKFERGKIADLRVDFDGMCFFEGLSLLPSRSFEQCMLGVTPIEPRIAHVYRPEKPFAAS